MTIHVMVKCTYYVYTFNPLMEYNKGSYPLSYVLRENIHHSLSFNRRSLAFQLTMSKQHGLPL
nr:MAG TPA: hypothetical protein [Caudoviricetes sp.]